MVARRAASIAWVWALASACSLGRGCSSSSSEKLDPAGLSSSTASGAPCPRFAAPRQTGRAEPSALVEASGLVASRQNAGVLWIHNDSRNGEQLFALSTTGKALATYSLAGARCVDWEDIALGPAANGGWDLYVGDTGTNQAARSPLTVYRMPEPAVRLDQPPVEAVLRDVESFELVYPNGDTWDSETLMIDPTSRDLYLVTKTTSGISNVYRAAAPIPAGARRELELVTTLEMQVGRGRGSERTTGGDISPDGRWILIKTYTHGFLWERPENSSVAQALSTRPCEVPLAVEQQGEAIGFAPDGSGYFTVSEGSSQPIYFFERWRP